MLARFKIGNSPLHSSEFKRLKKTRFCFRKVSALLSNTLPFDFHSRPCCVGMWERKTSGLRTSAWESGRPSEIRITGNKLKQWVYDISFHAGPRTEHTLTGTSVEVPPDCLKSSFKTSPANRDQTGVAPAFGGHQTAVTMQTWLLTLTWSFGLPTLIRGDIR